MLEIRYSNTNIKLCKIINVILTDFKNLLDCEVVNCFTTNSNLNINSIQHIDTRIAKSYFKDNLKTNLNQNIFSLNSKCFLNFILKLMFILA